MHCSVHVAGLGLHCSAASLPRPAATQRLTLGVQTEGGTGAVLALALLLLQAAQPPAQVARPPALSATVLAANAGGGVSASA